MSFFGKDEKNNRIKTVGESDPEKQLPDPDKKDPEETTLREELMEYLRLIVTVVVVVLLVENFLVVNARIPSGSMQNTIMKGDQIIANRLSYINSDPERFDIVIFKYPDDESEKFIKRVIGLPGETVEIRDGKVYINGSDTPLDDSFCPETPLGDFGPYEVPEGCYFMLGDNRNNSKDSRYWANTYVEKDKILGKAIFRYWPLNKISLLK